MHDIWCYFGGKAASGASYEIEARRAGDTVVVRAFSAGNGLARKDQGVLYTGTDLVAAANALLKKARDKRKPGERSYTRPFEGTPDGLSEVGDLPKAPDAHGTLPSHPQLWQAGQDEATLPFHVRAGGTAGKTDTSAIRSSAVTPTVMLPRRAPLRASATTGGIDFVGSMQRFLADSWICTRKIDGMRMHIQHTTDGAVYGGGKYNQPLAVPPAVADQIRRLPRGIHLDGELAAMTDDGRESLYAGGDAVHQVYTVFDLRMGQETTSASSYAERRRELDALLALLDNQTAVMGVPTARTRDETIAMVQRCLDDGWEGIVAYDAALPYRSGKVPGVFKIKPSVVIDAVVMGYREGAAGRAGRVGALELGLYNADGVLIPIGGVAGFTDEDLARVDALRNRGETGYVVTVRSFPPTFNLQINKGAFVRFRGPSSDDPKEPTDCTFHGEDWRVLANDG